MPVGNSLIRNGSHGREISRDVRTNGDEESSNSEDESSFYDEDESERRKVDCLDDMQFLEQQFSDLKEMLYQERIEEIERKIVLVSEESATEYLHPLRELEESLQSRLETAALQHQCRVANVQNKYDEEVQSTQQDFHEMCRVVLMRLRAELEEKQRRLREEKLMAELAFESSSRKRKSKVSEFLLPEKRKKPVTVTGVVYMLRDMDIMEDLNDIRKGRASFEVQQRTKGHKDSRWR